MHPKADPSLYPARSASPTVHAVPAGNARNPGRRGLPFAFLAGLLLSACLSDGPNQTGGDYLGRHGILLETPLYKVTLADFPVDSFWTGDLEPSGLADSILLLGETDGFSSQMRLAFDVADTAFLDSLDAGGSLRLSLSFPKPTYARAELESTLVGATQMKVLVESWVVRDVGLTAAARGDSLRVRMRRFLGRQDTASLIPGTPLLDTLVLKLDKVYQKGVPDSVQASLLARLRDTLRTDASAQWTIQMQLTALPDSADSASRVLVRLGGNLNEIFIPNLLFGDSGTTTFTANAKTQKVVPLRIPDIGIQRGLNYKLRFTGPDSGILVGKNQGLHLRVDRTAFLNSLDSALKAQNVNLKRGTGGEFDLTYFVPFAHIRLPVDTAWVEGGFPLEFRLLTDLDSLLPAPDRKAASQVVIVLGEEIPLVTLTDPNNPSRVVDTQWVAYGAPPQDSGLRRVIIRSSRDTARRDTAYFQIGQSREMLRAINGVEQLVYSVTADSASAGVAVHINTKSEIENNFFRDPATGARLTALNDRIPRFFTPGVNDTLSLRATRGFQRILNRARMGEEISSDFFVQPFSSPAADTATNLLVPYPVMGELRPVINSGRLGIDITIYLYPLKDR